MKGYTILFLLGGISNCYMPPVISPTHRYDVYIDDRFSADQKESITNSVIEWQINTNDTVSFDFVNYKTSSNPIIVILPSDKIYLHKHFHSITVGDTAMDGYNSKILIDVDQNKRDFHQVALHEIGHALCLDHDESANSVMYGLSNMAADTLTCRDMKAFCRLWGCVAADFTLCQIGR